MVLSKSLFLLLAITAQSDPTHDDTIERTVACTENELLESEFYEMRFDAALSEHVTFIRSVPLIASNSTRTTDAQILTILALHGETLALGKFMPRVHKMIRAYLDANAPEGLTNRGREQFVSKILTRVLSTRIDTSKVDSNLREKRSTRRHHRGHRRDPLGRRQVGFLSAKTRDTVGQRALDWVHEHLADRRRTPQTINDTVGFEAIELTVHWREDQDQEYCKRLLDDSVPFILHRDNRDWLVCGFAALESDRYWLAFDLDLIDLRVTIASSSGSMELAEFRAAESTLREQNPDLYVLYWDYRSYFSSKNLPAFCLLPQDSSCNITALFPSALDEDAVSKILKEESKLTWSEQSEDEDPE